MSYFIPLVILAEVSGLTGIALIITWMTKFLGGFAWDGYGGQFNVHPLLMVIGMLFFNGNALLLFRTTAGLNLPRMVVKIGHLSLQQLAIILGIVGLVAVFGFHNKIGVPNMYSFHSWVGMTTFVMFGLQFLCGFLFYIILYFGWARSERLRSQYLPIHVFFGKLILIMATITTCIGIQEKAQFSMSDTYKDLPHEAYVAHFAGASLIIFTSTVMYIMSNDSYRPIQGDTAGYQHQVNH